jgi:hypothetical protein
MIKRSPRLSRFLLCAMVGATLLSPFAARAQAPAPIGQIISYQGLLTGANGLAVPDGPQNLTFRIFENGAVVFNQASPVVSSGGVFNAFLSVNALAFDPAKTYELGITFAGTETLHPIAAVPVAINAKAATNAASAVAFTGALVGDVTGTQGATTVGKIQGVPVTPAGATTGQVLRFNGTAFAPSSTTSGTVTAVTANGPLSVTNPTTTPEITLGTVPVANGGTGNTTGAVAGDVTGTLAATVVSQVGGQTAANVASGAVAANAATSANTANTIVKRDANGDFAARIITGNLAGNATSATTATNSTDFSGTLTGDVTGTQKVTVVERLRGTALSTTPPTAAGQVLTYDGAQYAPAAPAASTVQSDNTTITGDGTTNNKLAIKVPLALSGDSTSPILSATNTNAATGGAGSFNITNAGNSGNALTASTSGTGNAINATGKISATSDISTATQYNIGTNRVLALPNNSTTNVAVGVGAGAGANNTGTDNAFVGTGAGFFNTTGGSHAFVGAAAGFSNTTGEFNAFFGTAAGRANSTGVSNIGLGNRGGAALTGSNNIAIGNEGLTADANAIRLGRTVVQGMQNPHTKTFIAGISGVTPAVANPLPVVIDSNGQLGTGTVSATSLSGIVPIENGGTNSSTKNFVDLTTDQTVGGAKTFTSPVNTNTQYNIGTDNNGAGSRVLALTGGSESVAVGVGAGAVNTSAMNTFVGANAGQNTTGRADDTSVGRNVFLGTNAGQLNTTGGFNTFVGTNAGKANTTGRFNAFVGLGAGQANSIGTNNIALGNGAGLNLTTGNDNIAIGNAGVADEDNTMRLGNPFDPQRKTGQNKTFIAGIRGTTGLTGTLPVVIDADGQLGEGSAAASSLTLPLAQTETSASTLFALTNQGTGSAGAFKIDNPVNSNQGNPNAALSASTNGIGSAGSFTIDNTSVGIGTALIASTNGSGSAGSFSITNTFGNGTALKVSTLGTGPAGSFTVDNTDNSSTALSVSTNGTSGTALSASSAGQGPVSAGSFSITNTRGNGTALSASTIGSGNAGSFTVDSEFSFGNALTATSKNKGVALQTTMTGLGSAGEFKIENAGSTNTALSGITNGSGSAVVGSSSGGASVVGYSNGFTPPQGGTGVQGYGNTNGGYFVSNNGGTGVQGILNTPTAGSTTAYGVYGSNGNSNTDGYAGYFNGRVNITQGLTVQGADGIKFSDGTSQTTAATATTGTSANTPNTLVQRDGTGGFAAGAITATTITATTSAVVGSSIGGAGVEGYGNTYGGYFASIDVGVYGESGSGIGVHGVNKEVGGLAGKFDGNVQVTGTVTSAGFITASSQRFKQDIAEIGADSNELFRLRPVSYRYTADFLKAKAPSGLQYGLIAEEVARVYPTLVHFGKDGQPDGVKYQELPVLLLSQIQKQKRELDQQQLTNNQQQLTINELLARLGRLEAARHATLPVAPLGTLAAPFAPAAP